MLVGVASLTIPLSGRSVLYTTRNKTLLRLDLIASKDCLVNFIEFKSM